jgi:hypothetical protein
MSRVLLSCAVVLVGTLAACSDGYGNNSSSVMCATDADCGGQVCARTHECLDASQVRRVMTRWTLGGLPASAAQCTTDGIDHLEIQYTDDATGESDRFSPVPCGQGQFLVDIWPNRFNNILLEGFTPGHYSTGVAQTRLGDSGDVDTTLDVPVQPLSGP